MPRVLLRTGERSEQGGGCRYGRCRRTGGAGNVVSAHGALPEICNRSTIIAHPFCLALAFALAEWLTCSSSGLGGRAQA